MNTKWYQRTVKLGKREFTAVDIVFFLTFCAVAVYFFLSAPFGITVSDETMYQHFSYRIISGDRLFVDDWMISNLISLFTYVPCRVYTAITGGVEGLALAMRILYIIVKMILFFYIYAALRERGLWAVMAAVLFVGTDLFGIKTLNYYSVCVNALLLTCMLLFVRKGRKKRHCFIAGFLFSCAVVAEPVAALVWFLYTLAVVVCLMRRKAGKTSAENYAFVLAPQVWLYLFFGICAAAALFFVLCGTVFVGTDLPALAKGLKAMLGYISYDNGSGGSTLLVRLYKPLMYCFYFGVYFVVPFAVLETLALIPSRVREKYGRQIFAALCVLYMLMSVHLILYPAYRNGNDAAGESVSHPLLLPLLSLPAYALTKQKNRKLFAFLLTSFAVSVSVDLFSNNSFGSVMLVGCVPAVLLIGDYIAEQAPLLKRRGNIRKNSERKNAGYKKENAKAPLRAVLCVLLAFIPAFEVWHYAYMAQMHETERFFCKSSAPLDAEISNGVLKGIRTTAELRENYEKSIRDAKRISGICEKGLIVVDYDTTVYLHSGCRVFTPGTHITGNDWHTEEAWWTLYPEKRPDVAYIPYFTLSYIEFGDITPEEKLAYFEKNADITVTEGEIGYIVKIGRWH